jgi:toxin ParE1/3/4
MKYRVLITDAAYGDLEEIYDWIRDHDSPARADYVFDRVIQAAKSIAALPNRGSRPRELPPGTDAEYRQVFFKPYRIIYEVDGSDIVVHLIADGRRNLQSLLLRRLTTG